MSSIHGVSLSDTLPEEVYPVIITSFNTLITKNYSEYTSKSLVTLNDVVNMAKSFIPSRKEWDMKWFNMEEEYRHKGWIVKYYSPALDETFEPLFIFSKNLFA